MFPQTSNQPYCVGMPTWVVKLTFFCCCSAAKSCLTLCNPMTVAHQAPLSMEFPWQEYWSMLPFPLPGDLPNPGIKPTSLVFPELSGGFSTTSASWEAHWHSKCNSSYFIFFLRDLTHSTEHSVDNYCLGRRNNTGKAGPVLRRQRGGQGDTQTNENNGGH